MRLCTISLDEKVHKAIFRSPMDENGNICHPGQEGPACGISLNIFSHIENFDGEASDITCKSCREDS